MDCALTVMFGFLDWKSLTSASSFIPLTPVCVCQNSIVTGLLIVTLSIGLPVPAAASIALSASCTLFGTETEPPVAAPAVAVTAAAVVAAEVAAVFAAVVGAVVATFAAVVAALVACAAACVAALLVAVLL